MKTYRDLSVPSLIQFGTDGTGATPSDHRFRRGRRPRSGALRTVGIIAVTVVLAGFNGFSEAEAATVCEGTVIDYAVQEQCDEVPGTVAQVASGYLDRGYIRFQDTTLWRETILPEYGDLLADIPCEFLIDRDLAEDTDYLSVRFTAICDSTGTVPAGVTISPTALRIVEGTSATYAVSLDSAPEGAVSVSVEVLPLALPAIFPTPPTFDVTVSTTSLSFSPSNWSQPRTVTVRVAEDDHVSGDIQYTIVHGVSGYGSLTAAANVTVNAIDNDSPGVTVTPLALTVAEGGSGTYTVVLDANPDPGQDGLTVTVTPAGNNADVTFSPATLTFTGADWDDPQTVEVSAAHDDDAVDESATLTHAVSGYGDVTSAAAVTVNVVDDDSPGVTVTPLALTVAEGGSGTYTVVLDANPDPGQDGLTVTVTPAGNNADVTFSPATLTFTGTDWDDPQTVEVSAAHDDDAVDESATLTHAVSGYGDVTSAAAVTVNVVDDDSPGVTVTPLALTVAEGGSGTYTVVLDANPDPGQDGLTVTVTPAGNNADVTFSPATLTFTGADWDDPQTVEVSAAHDDDAVDESATLTHAVSGYGDVTSAAAVTVNVVDDDSPGVTVTPLALTVAEGGSGTYTVVLDANPDPGQDGLTVTVTPAGNNADVTFSPATLTFTGTDWDDPQTVEVSAAHDDDAVDESATLTHAVSGYGDVTSAAAVTVNVVDDDSPGVTVTPLALTVAEGGSGTYTVVLDANPDPGQDGLTVTVTPAGNNADVTFSPATLTFTGTDWDDPQTVEVSAAHDDDAVDESATLTHAVSGYGDVTSAAAVTVNVVDDDSPGVTVTPLALTVAEGGSGTYTVVLDANPDPGQDGLTVTVTPAGNNADVTFSPATLTFTGTDWDDPQTVEVSAAHDDDAVDESATLTHAVSGYGDVTSAAAVTVNVVDDDTAQGPPGAPRNLRAMPGDGEVTLTWSAPLDDGGTPIVGYEYQVDGGAWSDTDGPARHVVGGLTNGTQYTFGVRAINAVSAQDPDSESTSALATAVPRAETVDSIEREAISETVEAVTAATAANIAANIGTRFAAARSGGTVVVGGQPVNFGPVSGSTVMYADAGRDRDPFDEFSSAYHGRSLGVDELLHSSAFEISLNATEDESQGGAMSPQWTMWGRGDFQFFESLPDQGPTYDGSLQAGYLGIDARMSDRWLFGLAASLTNTEADYGLGDGSGGEGRLDAKITGLHPYLRYSLNATSEIWTILGLGRGEITNERASGAAREASDMDMRMAAAGARTNLLSDGEWNLALLGDFGIAQVETEDGVQAVQGLSVDTWRGRLGVEGSHTALLESGYAVTTFAEVAGRYDGGGDDDEVGLEISPGVFVAGPNGLGFEVRGRMLALHTAENYEEYGASMTFSMSPRPGGTGLSLSFRPRVGGGAESADTLWREDPFALSSARSAERDALSLDVGLGYGIRAKNGLLTPFGEFSMRDEGSRRSRAGARFSLTRSSLGELSLGLLGERHEPEGADPEHGVVVTGRLRF